MIFNVAVSDHKVSGQSFIPGPVLFLFTQNAHPAQTCCSNCCTLCPSLSTESDNYVFSGCHSELFLALLTSDSVPSSFFFLTANEKPAFDKLLLLPVGARCVESGFYGDQFGVSVYVFVGLVMCGSSDKLEREETVQKK